MKSTVLSLFAEVSIDFLFIKQSIWVILRARQGMNYTKINMLGHSILLQRSCNLTCVGKNSSLWLVFYFPFTAITKGIVRDNLVISSTEGRGALLLLLLLLSCFSRVRLCATPWTAAYQASPSMGFSRQEHGSGLPFPSPMHESGKWKWSCSVVSDS